MGSARLGNMPPVDPGAPHVPPVISTRWQLARDAAVRYQDVLVPWILGPFAEALVELANPRRGESVLDVGCGTGAVARAAAFEVGRSGRVVGLDLNVGMLEVARGIDPAEVAGDRHEIEPAAIEWLEASATAIPLADRSFDAVVSAQVFQFVPELDVAAAEIRRVLKPGGRAAVSVWRGMESNPYFAAQVAAVTERLGVEAAGGLVAGFRLTDPSPLAAALTAAGLEGVEIATIDLLLNLPPLADWAPRHLAATPVATALGAAPGIARELGADIAQAMADYSTPDGVRVPFSSWVVEGRAPDA
jgi:SAM-dependent methyltransferase